MVTSSSQDCLVRLGKLVAVLEVSRVLSGQGSSAEKLDIALKAMSVTEVIDTLVELAFAQAVERVDDSARSCMN